jgi:hypothetical protein
VTNGRNTKTGLYLDAIHSSKIFNKIINSTPKPNAMTRLEEVDRDETCLLGVAGDVVMMLIDGLISVEGVEKCVGEVESAEFKVCLSVLQFLKPRREASLIIGRSMDYNYRLWKGLSTPTPSLYWLASESFGPTYPLPEYSSPRFGSSNDLIVITFSPTNR